MGYNAKIRLRAQVSYGLSRMCCNLICFCFGFLLFNIASISLIAVQNQCYFCEIFIKKIASTTMLECVLWCYHLIVWVLCSVFSICVRLSHLFFCGCNKQWKEFLHKIKQTDLTVTVCSTLARTCNYRMADKKSLISFLRVSSHLYCFHTLLSCTWAAHQETLSCLSNASAMCLIGGRVQWFRHQ